MALKEGLEHELASNAVVTLLPVAFMAIFHSPYSTGHGCPHAFEVATLKLRVQ